MVPNERHIQIYGCVNLDTGNDTIIDTGVEMIISQVGTTTKNESSIRITIKQQFDSLLGHLNFWDNPLFVITLVTILVIGTGFAILLSIILCKEKRNKELKRRNAITYQHVRSINFSPKTCTKPETRRFDWVKPSDVKIEEIQPESEYVEMINLPKRAKISLAKLPVRAILSMPTISEEPVAVQSFNGSEYANIINLKGATASITPAIPYRQTLPKAKRTPAPNPKPVRKFLTKTIVEPCPPTVTMAEDLYTTIDEVGMGPNNEVTQL